MQLKKIDGYFRRIMDIERLGSLDRSLNGIQVDREKQEIQTIGFAVDACLASFEQAKQAGADLVVVHHGLFWGHPLRVKGNHYKRLKFLLENDIALYAVHLPLDMHPGFGNNSGIANGMKLINQQPFGAYKGMKFGIKGELQEKKSFKQILEILGLDETECTSLLPFGPKEIKTVGILSGGAPKEVEQAIAEELDLYITGDASHGIYHTSLEAGINVICAGHYQTEIWGVRSLAQVTQQDLKLNTLFIDIPTGL